MPAQQIFKFEPAHFTNQYCAAQLKERHGKEQDGWINKLFWGDNRQVMSHLIKEFSGKINLIYIDPPFDDKAAYKKKIEVRGQEGKSNSASFEEKQYGNMWTDDEYLQFMYERLILMRELLSNEGSIFLHCDWHKSHHLRMLMDNVFGPDNFKNEIIWCYGGGGASGNLYSKKHDTLFWYVRSGKWCFNKQYRPYSEGTLQRGLTAVKGDYQLNKEGAGLDDWWADKSVQKILSPTAYENVKYPTQKPEGLLKRIILGHSNPGDIVFDCFMGSGTAQAVAMKLGRRFIGADINLGAVQTTTKRLLGIKKELESSPGTGGKKYTCFEVYKIDIEIVAMLRSKSTPELKKESEADVQRKGDKLVIKEFYPMNLMQKLGFDRETVSGWQGLVDSVMIDFNYAGAEMEPSLIDIPKKNKFVKGEYDIPKDAGRIKVKITDILSESLEVVLEVPHTCLLAEKF